MADEEKKDDELSPSDLLSPEHLNFKMIEMLTQKVDEINTGIQAKMEFIVEQQAQFAANIQAHDERLAELDNIVKRIANAMLSGQEDFNVRLAALTDAQMRTEEALAKLAESQAHTDKRLDALIDIVREERNGKP